MADAPEEQPRGWQPTIPTAIVAGSVIVALVAVSGLLVVLFRRTTGPGEILRDFSRRIVASDCPGSYALLAPTVKARVAEDAWCERVPALAEHLAPTFSIGERTFHEGIATVAVRGEGTTPATWLLRSTDGSWQVLGVRDAPIDFPGSSP